MMARTAHYFFFWVALEAATLKQVCSRSNTQTNITEGPFFENPKLCTEIYIWTLYIAAPNLTKTPSSKKYRQSSSPLPQAASIRRNKVFQHVNIKTNLYVIRNAVNVGFINKVDKRIASLT